MDQEHVDALAISKDELLRRFEAGTPAPIAAVSFARTYAKDQFAVRITNLTGIALGGVFWSVHTDEGALGMTIY